MGVVYRARHIHLEMQVAVKVMLPHVSTAMKSQRISCKSCVTAAESWPGDLGPACSRGPPSVPRGDNKLWPDRNSLFAERG